MLASFLSPSDAKRALTTLRKLAQHDIGAWAITGGIATELYVQLAGRPQKV